MNQKYVWHMCNTNNFHAQYVQSRFLVKCVDNILNGFAGSACTANLQINYFLVTCKNFIQPYTDNNYCAAVIESHF